MLLKSHKLVFLEAEGRFSNLHNICYKDGNPGAEYHGCSDTYLGTVLY